MNDERTCLSWWFPRIAPLTSTDYGRRAPVIKVPRTHWVKFDAYQMSGWWEGFDGKPLGRLCEHQAAYVQAMACEIVEWGQPFFLRTGLTSGKHNWDKTCAMRAGETMLAHMFSLIEYSEMAGGLGLDSSVWVVREMLPTKPVGVCRRYGNMPVCREFRYFARDGQVECWHPYWPHEALDDGDFKPLVSYRADGWFDVLDADEERELNAAAAAVSNELGGGWSIDFLETANGWYLTDMAEAEKSFHWEGCPNGKKT